MIARVFGWLLTTLLVATATPVRAQQSDIVHRIGYMANALGIRPDTEDVFRQALRDLGYIEGRTLTIEWRFSKGRLDLLPALAGFSPWRCEALKS